MRTRKAPSSFKDGTVQAVIATGNPVRRADANGEYLEILRASGADLTELNNGAHVLNNHRTGGVEDVLGSVVSAAVEGETIVATLSLSPSIAPGIRSAVESGDLNSISIGYVVEEWEEGVNSEGVRTMTATKWNIREVSFVAVPADPEARTRAALQELIKRQAPASLIIPTARNQETMTINVVEAAGEALFHRSNPRHTLSEAGRTYAGASLHDIARDILTRAGVAVPFGGASLIQRALTTSDFPLILANTVGRQLGASYAVPASGLRALATESSAADFRAKQTIKLDDTGITLEKVNESGEFKQDGTLIETAESYRLATFGRIISISRQALVNDDLGALQKLASSLGRAAVAFEATQITGLWTSNPAMADAVAVFHANHANVVAAPTWTDIATIIAALSAARLAMRKQVSPAGSLISVAPKYFIVSPERETAAEQALATINPAKAGDANPFQSALQLVVEPRLPSTYAYVASGDLPNVEYSYLSGAAGPQVETRMGFEIDGVDMRIRLDYGAGWEDHRGVVRIG